MSASLREGCRREHRRDYNEHEGSGGQDAVRKIDRGRRPGELSLNSSTKPAPRSPRASQQPLSPFRPGSRHDMPPKDTRPVSPYSLSRRAPVFAEPSKPAHTNAASLADSHSSNRVTAGQETQDLRLLKGINTSHTVRAGKLAGPVVAESSGLATFANGGAGDQCDLATSSSVTQNGKRTPSEPEHNLTPLTARKTIEQQANSANSLVTLPECLFENASTSAALKYDQYKVNAKATHQAKINMKMGDLPRTFPTFAETGSKARRATEKDLAALGEKLAEHKNCQADLRSAIPNLTQTSSMSTTTRKEREQAKLVQRCISAYEAFKANVEDLRQRFENHKSSMSHAEQSYQRMGRKIESSTDQVTDLSSVLESVQVRCTKLEQKSSEVEHIVKSFSGETRSSLTTLKISLKQCLEQGQQQKYIADTAADKVNQVLQRLDLLEMQYESFAKTKSIHPRKVKEVEKTTDDLLRHLRGTKVTASCHEDLIDAVKLMNEQIQDLRHALSDVQNTEPLTPPDVQEISELREDIAALKAGSVGLQKDTTDTQDRCGTGRIPSPASIVERTPRTNDSATNKSQTHLAILEERAQVCIKKVKIVQESLKEKENEEDKRDEIVAAQVDEVKVLVEKSREEIGSRITKLEQDIEKYRLEDLHRAKKLQDSFSQLEAAGQASVPRKPELSAQTSSQMHQNAQLQAASSSSPKPMVSTMPMELNTRLEGVESFLSAMRQQLSAISIAYQQLDHRYNNLSTEPVVRAMVRQIQLMYPYASEAQREILKLKRIVEPLGIIPVHMENVKRTVGNYEASFAKMFAFETRIDALEKEHTENDAKLEKLVERVEEERKKLIEEVNRQKEAANGLAKRLDHLEDRRKGEPDRLECLTEHVAKKLETESKNRMEEFTRRLEALEAEQKRQDLLGAFSGRFPPNKTADQVRESKYDDTDDSSVPLAVIKNGSKASKVSQSPTPVGTCKTFHTSQTVSNRKKRKRYGNQENNDRSDDNTYTPTARDSSTRRKLRG